MTGHEAYHDDLAAYALGALPADEAAAIDRHLDDCESCRERLRWLRAATDLLPASVEQRTPPPAMRERVMATVRAEAGARPEGAAAPARRSRWEGFRGLALRPSTALAAAALIAVGAGAGYALRGDDGGGAPASTFIEAKPLGGAQASASLELTGSGATLHVEELPELREGEVYEVWIQRGGAVEPGGVFVLDHDGAGTAAVAGPLEGADAVLVTREPSGGSRQPTTPPLVRASL